MDANEQPLITLDPSKLKSERGAVDLGPDEETGFDKLTRDRQTKGEDGSLAQPTGGATPPAR